MEKNSKEKEKRIVDMRAKMEKDFGKGICMGANEKSKYHEFISTGSLGLDKALGIGGLPRGRVIEIFGPESSGKTTLALEIVARAHEREGTYCAFVDVEHALDTKYAEDLGVDLDRLEISQPDYGEQALEITDRLISSGDFDVVVVDSVAALVPKSELEGEMGSAAMASQARLMSQALRKLVAITSKTNTVLIFINQMREKIGVMFGNPEVTTGGNALKFYASVRLDIRRSITTKNSVMDGDQKIGNQVTVKVVKNKVSPPFRQCEFDVLYGEGIDSYGELLKMGAETGVILKSGSYFSYNGANLGQGKDATITALKADNDLHNEIKARVIESYTPVEYIPEPEEKEK